MENSNMLVFIVSSLGTICVPKLSYVVVTCLSVCGADDTHAVAGLEVAELQQHHGQVVDKQLGVHEGHSKLDDPVVVLILLRPHHRFNENIHYWMKDSSIISFSLIRQVSLRLRILFSRAR